MPSEIAIELNSIGVPPASRTPSLTASARSRRWKLHGIASIQVLAMPTVGRRSAVVVEADALHVGARVRRGRGRRRRPPSGAGKVAHAAACHPPWRATRRSRIRSRLAWPGSTWRPGTCMFATEISSPLAGAQRHPLREDVVRVREPLRRLRLGAVREAHAVLVQELAGARVEREDRPVRVQQVSITAVALDPVDRDEAELRSTSAYSSSETTERRSSRARASARRSRPGS